MKTFKQYNEGIYTRNDGGAYDGLRIAKYLAHQDGKKWDRLSYGYVDTYLKKAKDIMKKDPRKAKDILSKPTP